MTQNDALLALLRERGLNGITPLDALNEVGSFRLAARIHDLRAEGHNIVTVNAHLSNGKTIARYVLIENGQLGLGFAL